MRKSLFIFLLVLSLMLSLGAFISCDDESDGQGGAEDGSDESDTKVAVTGISLDSDALSLAAGESKQLTASVSPDNATNKSVTWSASNGSVASVDTSGKVTAISAGICTVTATTADGGFTASCTVTVSNIDVSGITLDKTELMLDLGKSETVTVSIAPENATLKSYSWSSSDPSIVTVGADGKVTAVGKGSATITATTVDGGFTASCTVTVTAKVTGVSLNKNSLSLNKGLYETLVASISPEIADNKQLTWSSDNTAVATVDQNGKVTAVAKGTAKVTVTTADGGFTASCTVTVTSPATSVSLNFNTLTVFVGETKLLSASVSPSDALQNVLWSSSDRTVATVDAYGRVTAKKAGTATVTATSVDGGLTATCTVTVKNIEVTDVTLSQSTLSLDEGATATLICTAKPDNATDKSITWTSSNPSVASVVGGKVTAMGAGTATITARSASGVTATCTVTVTEINVTFSVVGSDSTVVVPGQGTEKDGVTTTYWEATKAKTITLAQKTDLSSNDYLTFRVYSENATGYKVQLRFSYANEDKLPSQGMAPYFRYIFTVDFTGWKEFTVDLDDFLSNYSPSWRYISNVYFDCKGWEMGENPTLSSDTKLYFDDIKFVKTHYSVDISGSKTESEYLSDAKLKWKHLLTGNGGTSDAYRTRVTSAQTGAINAWKNYSFAYEKTFVGTGTDSAHTLFKISYASADSKKYGKETNLGTLYAYIQMMARGYVTEGTTTYHDPELLKAIKNSLDYAYNNYYGIRHELDADLRQWVKQTNWWWWEIGIPSYVVDILMMLHEDLTQEEINKYLIPVDYFVPKVKYTACNRLWVGKIAYASAILQNDTVKAIEVISDLGEIFDYVSVGDGFYVDGSFVQHGAHPYTGGYGTSLLTELTQFMLCIEGTPFAFPRELTDRHYDWLYNTFEPVMVNKNVMASVKGREAARSTEFATFKNLFASFVRAAYYATGENKTRLEGIVKYFLLKNGDSVLANIEIGLVDYAIGLKTDASVTPRSSYEIAKVFGSMDRVVQHRPFYSVMLSFSSTRIYKYEAINDENQKGWYQGDGMIYIYTDGYDFTDSFFKDANTNKLPGTTVTAAERKEENLTGGIYGIYGSSDFAGGVTNGKYSASALILGYAQNKYFNTDITAKKSYFTFDSEIVCIGNGISESTTGKEVYTTIENRLWRSGDVFKVDGTSATSGSKAARYMSFTNMGGYIFDGSKTVNYTKNGGYLEITVSHGVNPTDEGYFFIYLPNATDAETKAYADAQSEKITVLSASNKVHAVRDNELGVTGYVFYEAGSCGNVTVSAPCTVMISEANGEKTVRVSDPTHKLTEIAVTVDGTPLTFNVAGNVGNTYFQTV